MSSMLTPAAPERQGDLGDGPRPVLDRHPQLVAARRPRARPRAGGGGRRGRRRCQPATASSSPVADQLRRPRRGASGRRRRSPPPPPRGWLAKMSPQIAGFAPATRVVSRKLGPTSGRRSDSSASGRCRLLDEHVGDHVRQVADGRHQAIVALGVDRLRPGAEVGDRALEPVVQHATRSARSASGTSARPRRGPRARSRRPAVSAPASGWPPMKRSAARPRARPPARALVEPTSVTTASGPLAPERLGDQLRKRATGAAQKITSAPSHRLGHRCRAVDRPAPRARARARASPDRDRSPPTSALEPPPRGQPDRAADQPDAEDGDSHRRGSARRRRRERRPASRSRTPRFAPSPCTRR